MPYLNLNGINTYYEVHGSGPPVVFIHGGYGGPSSTLAPPPTDWLDQLADRFTIITYDRRSCGRSTYPNSDYTFDDIVNDLSSLITNLQLTIQRQQAGPNKFTLSPSGPGPQTRSARINAITRAREVAAKLKSLPYAQHQSYVLGELRNLGAYLQVDLRPVTSELIIPTLILHGDADSQVPYALGKELSLLIPNSTFVTIPNAGHGLMSWPQTIQEIRSFLLQY